MFKELSLYRVVYSVLTTQIKFGVYKAGDQLPFLEEANTRFLVSFDTLREAYLQMQQEGYITLKKKTGAVFFSWVKRLHSDRDCDIILKQK